MPASRQFITVCAIIAVAAMCGCGVSTANLSSLKLSKDKAGTQETATFGEKDTLYGVAVVSNNPGKVKVIGRLVIEAVEGEKAGPIPGLEVTLDVQSPVNTATFTFSPPDNGWPEGKYKLDVIMTNEEGKQMDQKSASFTIG